ncbi:hypothetical protein [Lutispora thermophila]|uniref:hypothetical protein n=1 Tax=Lutispora thermophila TaxID=288966 RepID=UPI0009334596|nr:hypothetical protein [Lutispora thermophila]
MFAASGGIYADTNGEEQNPAPGLSQEADSGDMLTVRDFTEVVKMIASSQDIHQIIGFKATK